ncbi:unnamed protein product [Effrenium voratum]|nr:unnamed protein product [Effrenium voratum]
MEDARVEEAFRTMDHESFSRMMWHIGKAAIVATCILGLMMCLALAKGWRLGRGGEKPGYVVPKRVWITLLLPNALMHACGGLLLVAAPQYVMSSSGGDASDAGIVAGSFGLGLVMANLIAFKLGNLLPAWLMCIVAAITGLVGVLLGGLLSGPDVRIYGLAAVAALVGFAQSLHVVARTFYQAEVVRDGQAFVSGWVSASNIVGIAAAALVTSFVDCTNYTHLGLLCGGGLLAYGCLVTLLTCCNAAADMREQTRTALQQKQAGSPPVDLVPTGVLPGKAAKCDVENPRRQQKSTSPWLSGDFWKVCFLIFTMAIAREAQKFLIPLVGAEAEIHTSFVGNVAFMSQMESLVAAPVGGFLMESLGILPLVLVSLLMSAVGIQVLCMPGVGFYVQGASLLGLACGLCAGAAIALSILYAPEGRTKTFINGCRFFNSAADVVIPFVVGALAESSGILLAGSSLTLSMLGSICIALFAFNLQLLFSSDSVKDVRVPSMDFVIPLKTMGPFTRTVLEAIHSHYAPRQIFIVCKQDTREAVSQAMVNWGLPRGKISFVDEDSFFQRAMGFSREDLKRSWTSTGPRDFGWWWQQLLKLGAGSCIENISENFCVWDADLIVLEPWPLMGVDGQCYVAPLQEAYLSDRHQEAYESNARHVLKMDPTNPSKGGTWIAHHMVFNKTILLEMLSVIESNLEGPEPWPLKILQTAETFERMSEYVIYGTYASSRILKAHSYQRYGSQGLRLYGKEEAVAKGRDCNEFLMQRLNSDGKPITGYSYQRVAAEVCSMSLTHLQMEHV